MNFSIVKTNIVNVAADAIVLPANSLLREGSGTSAALFQAAGRQQLKKACQKIGNCPVGNSVPTPAFDLSARYIIHAVVPKWIDGEHDEYAFLSSAYLSALKVAELLGCKSIAFPLLASGNNSFRLDLAFEIAKKSIESHTPEHLKTVVLVIRGEKITSLVMEQGYSFDVIPEDINKKPAHPGDGTNILEEGKDSVKVALEGAAEKVFNYLKSEEFQELLIQTGKAITLAAVKAAAGKLNKIKK